MTPRKKASTAQHSYYKIKSRAGKSLHIFLFTGPPHSTQYLQSSICNPLGLTREGKIVDTNNPRILVPALLWAWVLFGFLFGFLSSWFVGNSLQVMLRTL